MLVGCQSSTVETGPQRSRFVQADLPTGALGYFVEGTLAREAGDDQAALDLFLEASRRDERLILVNAALAEIYLEQDQASTAESFLRKLINLDPRTVRNYVLLGDALMVLERVNDALETYLRGVEIQATNGPANFGAGRALLALDRPGEARDYLKVAVDEMPGDGAAWLNYGRALSASSSPAEAEAAFRRALETTPEVTADVLQGLGVTLLQQNRPGEAISYLQRAAERSDQPADYKLLGDGHMLAGNYGMAADAYDLALDRNAEFIAALNAKGSARYRQYVAGGRLNSDYLNEAVDLWRQSLAVDPDQPRVRETLEQIAPSEDAPES